MLEAEWPLLLFTLLSQAAVGLYLAVVIVRELRARTEAGAAGAVHETRIPSLVTGGLMAVAVVLSLMHLGTPSGAYRALLNLGNSWLSREILMSILFGGLWLLAFVLELRGVGGLWLGRLAALAGAVLVWVMARLYMASVIPAWMSAYTLVAFAATTLVLGGLLMLAIRPRPEGVSPVGPVLVLAGVAVQLIGFPVYVAGLGRGVDAARESLALLMDVWQPALWANLGLVAATAVVAAVIWQRKRVSPAMAYGVLLLGVAGEALARVLFYAMGVPIGIG
jgi:anaerobic dimethyl sulfoxide reductase subunit C